MEIFYIAPRRSARNERITTGDLMIKIPSLQGEAREGFIRGKTLNGGYIDRLPISSVVFLTKEKLMTILMDARDNVNQIVTTLETIIDESVSKEDLIKDLIEKDIPFENKIKDLYLLMDRSAVSDSISMMMNTVIQATSRNIDLGFKDTVTEESSAEILARGVRPNSRRNMVNVQLRASNTSNIEPLPRPEIVNQFREELESSTRAFGPSGILIGNDPVRDARDF